MQSVTWCYVNLHLWLLLRYISELKDHVIGFMKKQKKQLGTGEEIQNLCLNSSAASALHQPCACSTSHCLSRMFYSQPWLYYFPDIQFFALAGCSRVSSLPTWLWLRGTWKVCVGQWSEPSSQVETWCQPFLRWVGTVCCSHSFRVTCDKSAVSLLKSGE